MLYRLSQGQSFYGTPPGWVTTLTLGVVQDFLSKDLLPSLQVVEAAHEKLMNKE